MTVDVHAAATLIAGGALIVANNPPIGWVLIGIGIGVVVKSLES